MPSMSALTSTAATLLLMIATNVADAAPAKFTSSGALLSAVRGCVHGTSAVGNCCLPEGTVNYVPNGGDQFFVNLDENDACPSGSTHLSDWGVSKVTSMYGLFYDAQSFDQPLNWDVSAVINMYKMFFNAQSFNQPLNWDVSAVTNMYKMFYGAESFNQPLNWDVSAVTTMYNMFYGAKAYNQDPFCGASWVDSTATKTDMFRNVIRGGVGTQELCECVVGQGTFGTLGRCVACPRGTYSEDTTVVCTQCELGKTTSAEGATAATDCRDLAELLSEGDLVSAIAQRQGSCI